MRASADGQSAHRCALRAARAHDPATRVPFTVAGQLAGSVARQHLTVLQRWPQWLELSAAGVELAAEPAARDQALTRINAELRAAGLIRAWRDETFAITGLHSGQRLARTERAAARFWGTLTLGAHATGYVAGAGGRPTHLWIAQRALSKATDPGLFDNLVGGGVPDGQTSQEALVREGWEEAGLSPLQMQATRAGRVLRTRRDTAEGLQFEDIHAFDLLLPAGLQPCNQDGEVAGFNLLPLDEALHLAATAQMTVDAALVTLDFAWRHGLRAEPAEAAALFDLR